MSKFKYLTLTGEPNFLINNVYVNTLYHQETVVHNVVILWYLQDINRFKIVPPSACWHLRKDFDNFRNNVTEKENNLKMLYCLYCFTIVSQ